MAEPLPTERLQPALLDRLTDNEPESRVEAREARVLTKSQLRAAVLRELERGGQVFYVHNRINTMDMVN